MGKKSTFTCKICGGEHAGLICTKFQGQPSQKSVIAGLLAAPAKPKKKKAKKKAKTNV